jgi:hypothetical protein
MDCIVNARLPARVRLALIVAGLFALLGSFATPAQAGYYGDGYYRYNPCSYRCGYPAYRYGCSSCGCRRCGGYRRSVVYERRYIEREYVERRYVSGGYRRPCGYYGGCYRHSGYYGGYRRPWGYGYGYGGVGRRWPAPYVGGYAQQGYSQGYDQGYEEPPRPPEPIRDQGDYDY